MDIQPCSDDAIDDRPIAVRRKRRVHKLDLAEEKKSIEAGHQQAPNHMVVEERCGTTATTTTPRKKRVRFSDSGAEIVPSTSTGLTPFLRRHRVSGTSTPRIAKSSYKRRHSFPALIAPPATSSAATLQFAPLRQAIDGRSRRRLRRNNLSEEINSIEGEKRQELKLHRESIVALKEQVEEKDRKVAELSRQLWGSKACMQTLLPPGLSSSKVLPEESTREIPHSENKAEQHVYLGNDSFSASSMASAAGAGMLHDEENLELPAENELLNPRTRDARDITPVENQTPGTSATGRVPLENPKEELLNEEIRELKEELEMVTSELEVTESTHQRLFSKIRGHLQDSSSSFSDNPAEIDQALDTVLTSLVLAQSRAEDAEAGLIALSSNVKKLGFKGNNTAEILKALNNQFRQARLELEYLEPGETVEGFENGKLLSMLVDRIRNLLRRVRDDAEVRDGQDRVAAVLQKQFDLVDAQAKTADARVRELKGDVDEKERSIANLQRALEGYRIEVKSLENLVNRLEAEHTAAIGETQRAMDEAVADLEVQLEVEAKSKEDALLEAQEKEKLMEDLQGKIDKARSVIRSLVEERDSLVAARDAIASRFQIESLEKDKAHDSALAEHIADISSLCRDKTTLRTTLAEAEISISTLTDANTALEARLALEIEDGVRVMEAMQSEMMRCLARVGELKNGYSNKGEASLGVTMPATPCSLRFTPKKKKKRRIDSGIGVLEEDDEEMVDV